MPWAPSAFAQRPTSGRRGIGRRKCRLRLLSGTGCDWLAVATAVGPHQAHVGHANCHRRFQSDQRRRRNRCRQRLRHGNAARPREPETICAAKRVGTTTPARRAGREQPLPSRALHAPTGGCVAHGQLPARGERVPASAKPRSQAPPAPRATRQQPGRIAWRGGGIAGRGLAVGAWSMHVRRSRYGSTSDSLRPASRPVSIARATVVPNVTPCAPVVSSTPTPMCVSTPSRALVRNTSPTPRPCP